jgi:hypothetical protein
MKTATPSGENKAREQLPFPIIASVSTPGSSLAAGIRKGKHVTTEEETPRSTLCQAKFTHVT